MNEEKELWSLEQVHKHLTIHHVEWLNFESVKGKYRVTRSDGKVIKPPPEPKVSSRFYVGLMTLLAKIVFPERFK